MDLTNLRDSLDVSSRERHPASTSAKRSELRLTRDFKSAALQLTTLYRTSLSSAKRSYASGYAQSLQDVLDVVLLRLQQLPSSAPGYPSHHHHHSHHASASEANREELLWLARYLRARIEAIKADSEDEEDHESEEEAEDVQVRQASSSTKMLRRQSAPVKVTATTTSGAQEQAQGADEQAGAVDAGNVRILSSTALDTPLQGEAPSAPSALAAAVPPTVFSFTPPTRSAQDISVAPIVSRNPPQGTVRRRLKGGASLHGSSTNVVASTIISPRSASSVSSEEEATLVQPLTPSKRLSGRLGKRTAGRDKASAIVSAKRRRGMGDRREDDRRDGGLH